MQRHDAAVDLRADTAMADVGVHAVGEVERRRSGRQALDLALGREHVHLVGEQVDAQRVHELPRIARVLLPVGELRQPRLAEPRRRAGAFSLYSQCAAMPYSAVWCISCVRTWISSGFPCGPITVVCSDWYMFNLGMAM